ncbi:unnamed protein product [Symbiodinium natans]|uniref:Replication-associated protein n=1 Tax=Symbiodinium natans TaxID=878477 RepID=A0A812KD61_9DINO|nr:unnamed protein product [Symbiodinium natans]
MVSGPVQIAKRAFVSLLLALAQQYGLDVKINRDSEEKSLEAAYRKVVRRVHPDKGGNVADAQRLQAAREAWHSSKSHGRLPVRKEKTMKGRELPLLPAQNRKAFMIRSSSCLLTYHVSATTLWREFTKFVQQNMVSWGVQRWCVSMELCESGKPHVHLMVQFHTALETRDVHDFCFGQSRPNASATDLCGEGLCRKRVQQSIDRGFFYVFADKIGTVRGPDGLVCTEGNYLPCWTSSLLKYQVLGKWPETLWKQRKITSDVYEELLFLTRDGVISRQRNLRACQDRVEEELARQAVENRVQRIRGNPEIYRPFPVVPGVQEWLQLFAKDALRYPILIVLGASRAGKTEYAKSLFRRPLELKIGCLEFFPDTMRQFKRGYHDAIVLDDIRNLQFLVDHQEKVQGKYDCLVEFGSTAGGTCAFHVDLFGVPVVATVNYSTQNLGFLDNHDWLANPGNRVVVQL